MTLSRYATISTFDIGTDIVTQITDGSVLIGISVFDPTAAAHGPATQQISSDRNRSPDDNGVS
jgi:hypothetical protein